MPRQGNFRKTYYKSLGVHGLGVNATFAELLGEENPPISILINLAQLVHLALEFGVPAMYKPTVWCLVSQILPLVRDVEADTWGYARKEWKIMYLDIQAAFRTYYPNSSSENDILKLVQFYVDHIRPQLNNPPSAYRWVLDDQQVALGIINAVCQVLEDPMEQFWCTLSFLEFIDRGFPSLKPIVEVTELNQVSPQVLETLVFRT
ncbi:hypothetical protein THRCLA_10339, partial [Thraustotheca clavata]